MRLSTELHKGCLMFEAEAGLTDDEARSLTASEWVKYYHWLCAELKRGAVKAHPKPLFYNDPETY